MADKDEFTEYEENRGESYNKSTHEAGKDFVEDYGSKTEKEK